MEYKVHVQQIIPLTPEEKERRKNNGSYRNSNFNEWENDYDYNKYRPVLDVILTAEEYDALKKAVIGIKN